ncbi:T9SS type A sorting domain-containing protein [Aquimarina algiphila]|uniref:T9SS type A sorting domain-containing protein n=1 Tax=Aquimarina algiphila TaxID=2047982 RepID=A0A554VAT6_9FLAO|nr:T9SS type A sorting domain-containing protein [Aquimarina algiphila]TSE03329.1 T9SS type A sorting domain-containing protein [Aquimarina algiphila]
MRKSIFFYSMLLFTIHFGIAQVYNGNIVLTTQAEIDAFNYTEITGSLTIREVSPGAINNITNLSILKSIGSIRIEGNSVLNDIDGLSNLTSFGFGSVSIVNNASLQNINGLSNVRSEVGFIRIENNELLENIDGLAGLSSSEFDGGGLIISDNSSLRNVDGLLGITTVLDIFTISGNPELENLDGLSNAATFILVEFGFVLTNNVNLRDACGIVPLLKSYLDVGDMFIFSIENNGPNASTTETILNFDCCIKFEGDLVLSSQEEIDNFNYCEITGSLIIKESVTNNITDLSNLSKLEILGLDLKIDSNAALTTINGFENLTSIRIIDIRDNPSLVSVQGFTKLTKLDSFVAFRNDSLENIEGLSKIKTLRDFKIVVSNVSNLPDLSNLQSIRGDLNLDGTKINDLSALQSLQNIGNIFLFRNSLLDNIDGLSGAAINSIVIRITQNQALRNVDGLTDFSSIRADVIIAHNAELDNLDGLSNLRSVGGRLIIVNNPILRDACGIVSLLNIPGSVTGEIRIADNGSNTSSVDVIIENCTNKVQTTNTIQSSKLYIYPIPSNRNQVYIKNGKENTEYQIVSFLGEVVAEGTINSNNQQVIFSRSLQEGVYFVRITDGQKVENRTLVVN